MIDWNQVDRPGLLGVERSMPANRKLHESKQVPGMEARAEAPSITWVIPIMWRSRREVP